MVDWAIQEADSTDLLPVGMAAGHLVLGAQAGTDLPPAEDPEDSPTEGGTAEVEATEVTSNARVLGSKTGTRSDLGISPKGRPSKVKPKEVFMVKVIFDEWYSMMIDGETCCAVFFVFLSSRSQIVSFTHDCPVFSTWGFGILYFSFLCLC